ncbi:MAG: cupin domain-containing protein [Clostridiaceae bacterium]|nr:cupin domain-containing protein [Clostridiaceae bacterium]
MIIRTSEQRVETRTAMRGGNGEIALQHLVDGTKTYGKTRMMARLTFPAGASIGKHPHIEEAEAYIILSGEATVTENDVAYKLTAGDAAFTGNGDTHSIENAGSEDLVILAIIFN